MVIVGASVFISGICLMVSLGSAFNYFLFLVTAEDLRYFGKAYYRKQFRLMASVSIIQFLLCVLLYVFAVVPMSKVA